MFVTTVFSNLVMIVGISVSLLCSCSGFSVDLIYIITVNEHCYIVSREPGMSQNSLYNMNLENLYMKLQSQS